MSFVGSPKWVVLGRSQIGPAASPRALRRGVAVLEALGANGTLPGAGTLRNSKPVPADGRRLQAEPPIWLRTGWLRRSQDRLPVRLDLLSCPACITLYYLAIPCINYQRSGLPTLLVGLKVSQEVY